MFKLALKLVVVFSFAAVISSAVSAQTAPVSGNVIIKKADGTTAPVEGITVEAFRTDIKGSGPSATTDKRGNFNFAGLQPGAVYVLSFSGPGAAPTYYPNVKAGQDNLRVQMEVGDGRRLTPDEVRQVVAQAQNGGAPTEEDKKAAAEHAAKVKEVTEKNAKIEAENKIIDASLKEGNDAFTAKNWDLAVDKYTAGINANPTYAGSAPVLMNNRGAALRERAVKTYNE
ncbi:MAG TPA: carboxypeptidase-like regulatory domain-containing protein, partial [Pyrinomonadaceae bacterium]|nr:carboxypeptidase-like regulatory domain-containing protein [Pyrinomonadaceae bacterium]